MFPPSKNADFVAFAISCSATITAAPADYGLTSGQATTLATSVTALNSAWETAQDPSTRTPVTVQAFQDAKVATETIIRSYNQIAQLFPATSENLVAAGFPVRKVGRSPQQPITASLELAVISAVAGVTRMEARNPATPTSKKKPPQTGAVEVAIAIGTSAAISPAQATESRFYTKQPFDITTTPDQRGKIMVCWARWQSLGSIGGDKVYGPWSFPVQISLV